MSELSRDFRYAIRTLSRAPGFTLVALLTLALGIGANTALFTLIDQVLLRPLPVIAPERLVVIDAPGPFSGSTDSDSVERTPISHPMYEGLRDRNEVFSGVLAHMTSPVHLSVEQEAVSVRGDLVSGTFFEVLGVEPAVGRLLTPEDDRVPGAHPLVVLGHGFWERRFGGDPDVVGRAVLVNGHPMTVIGVAAEGFHGIEVGESVDVYVPLAMQPQVRPTWNRGLGDWRMRWLTPMARLRDGVSLDEARAGIDVLYSALLQEDLAALETRSESFRDEFARKRLTLLPGGRGTSEIRAQTGTPLLVLAGMVGLVLLIACANVANLLLARASARQKEMAVRLALGASRSRLARQLVVESAALSLAGGAAGMLVAWWTAAALLGVLARQEAPLSITAAPDLRVAGFAFALSLVTGIVFGLIPALQATRPDVAPVLKNETGAIAGGGTPFRFRKGLVVAQVALSLLLLVGAGLLTRSLANLYRLDPGFDTERLVVFSVDPALAGHPLERRAPLLRLIRDEIGAEPGVAAVSIAQLPLLADSDWRITVAVQGYESREEEDMNPSFNGVAPGFFATLGIPLLAGRDFTDADSPEAPAVAVVNEVFARYFFGAESPIGRRLGRGRSNELDVTIVGLVRDGKASSLREEPRRFVYLPYTQSRDLGEVTVYVRAAAELPGLPGRMRQIVQRADAGLPVTDLKTMRAQIGESLLVDRLTAGLSAAFGLLATLLAAVGLYGVMSYAVSLRTREIGIRMALGAEQPGVVALILREVAALSLLGVVFGLPGGYGLGRLVESQLFGLSARDPLTFAVATATLLLTAALAGYVPAARAARVDPIVALRYE